MYEGRTGKKDDLPQPQLYVVAVATSGIHTEKGRGLTIGYPFETVALELELERLSDHSSREQISDT